MQVIGPWLDVGFSDHSFGGRPNRSRSHALAVAEKLVIEGRQIWVCADLANAFENVPQAPLLQVLRKYIPVKPSEEIKRRQHNEKIHENLHSLLRKLIETPKRIGIRQGAATSSLFLNVYADHHLDRPWRRHCAAPLLRFADDILVPCTSSEEAEEAQATLMKLLAPTGLRCKEPKAGNKNIVDINRQEAEWLGYRIRWSSEGLIVLPGTLRTGKSLLRDHTSLDADRQPSHLPSSASSGLDGANGTRILGQPTPADSLVCGPTS